MRLRELTRPLNEDIIPARAKTWWAKYGPRVLKSLAVVNVALLIHDAIELIDKIKRLPKDKMTKEDYTASVLRLVGQMVATYGLPECMWALGAVIGGGLTLASGPGFIAGAGIGGIVGLLASFPVSFIYGDDIEDLVDWLVKKYYLGDETRSIRAPNDASTPEPKPYTASQQQKNYRSAQTGLDTPNNPNPRVHPERY